VAIRAIFQTAAPGNEHAQQEPQQQESYDGAGGNQPNGWSHGSATRVSEYTT